MELMIITRSMVCNTLLVWHAYMRVPHLHPRNVINTPLMMLLLGINIHIHAHPTLLLVRRESILMVGSLHLQTRRCIMIMALIENSASVVINYSYILCTTS
jgi:hypothetical protein